MKKRFRLDFFLFLMILVLPVIAQEKQKKETKSKFGWHNSIVTGLNLNQTSFDNWAQGGENTFAWQLNVNARFFNDREKSSWANSAKISYGRSRVANQSSRKSIDEIKLESVYTYKIGIAANPYMSITALTQSSTGFKYAGSKKTAIADFMDPGYFTQGIGFGAKIYDGLSMRMGTAFKETFTHDFPQPYADNPKTKNIEKHKIEMGGESVIDFRKKITSTTLVTSKIEMFSNLERFDEIDVKWDSIFSTKISKYFDVNLNVKIFYDKDVSKKRQLNQALALGLSYTFL